MYDAPKVVEKQLNRTNSPRKARTRSKVSAAEKKSLLTDVEAKRIELDDKQAQLKEFDQHINAAVSVIDGVRKNEELWDSLPETIRADFDEFAERYLL